MIQDRYKHGYWEILLPNGQALHVFPTMDYHEGSWRLEQRLRPNKPYLDQINPINHIVNYTSSLITRTVKLANNLLEKFKSGQGNYDYNDTVRIVKQNLEEIHKYFGDISSEFIERLKEAGLDTSELEQSLNQLEQFKQKFKNFKSREQVKEKPTKHKEKPVKDKSDDNIPRSDVGREVGHERVSMFDPVSSRPAQALGPFESRLRDRLIRIVG